MTVTCGVNGETLEDDAVLVCHHCGTPVCRAHGWINPADHAFADADAAAADRADPDPGTPNPVPHPPPSAPRPTPAPPAQHIAANAPPAVHCKKCAAEFHRNVTGLANNIGQQLKKFSLNRSVGRP